MLTEELKARLRELDAEIDKVGKEVAPLQERLYRLQESRKYAVRLLELENGTAAKITKIGRVVRRNSRGDPIWKAVADEYGYEVGKDSAHRVVARVTPPLQQRHLQVLPEERAEPCATDFAHTRCQ